MKQLIAVIALSAGFGVFADSTFNWTCNFGDDYAAEVAKYVSLHAKATETKVTGSNTQKSGETYLVLSDAETSTISPLRTVWLCWHAVRSTVLKTLPSRQTAGRSITN